MGLVLKPFVEKTHTDFLEFMGKINQEIDQFKGQQVVEKQPIVGKIFYVASGALAIVAALAYRKAHQYVAIGAGILSLASLAVTQIKRDKKTDLFARFEANCNLASDHITNAAISKISFMVAQVNGKKNGWASKHDTQLSTTYDEPTNTSSIDPAAITEEQTKYRAVHKAVSQALESLAATLKGLHANDEIDAEVAAVLTKVDTARVLLQKGSNDEKNITYIQYNKDGTAASWIALA